MIRVEFETVSKYDIPLMQKQSIDVAKIKLMSFEDAKPSDVLNLDRTLEFFRHDKSHTFLYDNPDEWIEVLRQYYAVLTPEFCMWRDLPRGKQVLSAYKERWCGAYWQSKGIRVIPSVLWTDDASLEYCLAGIPEGSVISLCGGINLDDVDEMRRYNKMLEVLKPSAVLCRHRFQNMAGNVIVCKSGYNAEDKKHIEDLYNAVGCKACQWYEIKKQTDINLFVEKTMVLHDAYLLAHKENDDGLTLCFETCWVKHKIEIEFSDIVFRQVKQSAEPYFDCYIAIRDGLVVFCENGLFDPNEGIDDTFIKAKTVRWRFISSEGETL